ncbi:hypothetical protein GCM10025859_51110 [Alicyclobacillus fastidiosus]|nr:hypothetical protein GCM10025859_51110 [Alicyclobacillus fastidiosus]
MRELDELYHIRALASSDLSDMRELTQAVGWAVVPWRLKLYQNIGHTLGALRGDKLVATIVAFRLGPTDVAVGQLIVHPSVQRQGLGRRLLQTVLDHYPDDNLHLIATQQGFPLYSHMGFISIGEVWRMEQGVDAESGRESTKPFEDAPTTSTCGGMEPALPQPFQVLRQELVPRLSDLDRNYTGFCRTALFECLVERGKAYVISRGKGPNWHSAALAVMERGAIRLGPLFAPAQEDAATLLQDAVECAKREGLPMRLDVYAQHDLLHKTAYQLGFQVKMQSPLMTLRRGSHSSPCNMFFCFDPATT